MKSPILLCGMSRSGTTLAATVLDSHPDISMVYELVTSALPPVGTLVAPLRDAIAATGEHPRKCGNWLRSAGHEELGRLVKRAARAGADPHNLLAALETLPPGGQSSTDATLALAMRLGQRKRELEGAQAYGLKLPGSGLGHYLKRLPDAVCLCLVRDPRDVLASQRSRGMAGDATAFAAKWRAYSRRFVREETRSPERVLVLRYEDLVGRPQEAIPRITTWLGLPFAQDMMHFNQSKASVHASGQRHVNAENLRRGFFTDSVGRAASDLSTADMAAIESRCGRVARRLGYSSP